MTDEQQTDRWTTNSIPEAAWLGTISLINKSSPCLYFFNNQIRHCTKSSTNKHVLCPVSRVQCHVSRVMCDNFLYVISVLCQLVSNYLQSSCQLGNGCPYLHLILLRKTFKDTVGMCASGVFIDTREPVWSLIQLDKTQQIEDEKHRVCTKPSWGQPCVPAVPLNTQTHRHQQLFVS